LDLKETLALIAGSINEAFDFSDAKIILVDKNKSISQAYLTKGEAQKVDLKELDTDPLVRYAMASLMPLSLEQDEIKRRLKTETHIKSFTSVPLIVANEVLGIITMADARPRYKGEDVLSRLCILAAQYAIEISKARLYEKLESLAITDGLTKVSRRHHFLERYNEEVSRAKKYNLVLSFLMADIDHFKNFNERYGHLYGDAVLRGVAKLLKQGIREVDLVCRYGGEEFAIMLPETTKSQAKLVAERLRQGISQDKFQAYGEPATLTISIGVASLPDDATSSQELLDKADEALLRAKSEGRNRVCLY
jgi:diguanylate cyclase (GGDEF)-like protein